MKKITKLTTVFAATAAFALSANAATISPTTAYGHNNKDNFGGNISDIYNGSGMNGNPETGGALPADINSWTQTGAGSYKNEWQADQLLDNTTSINAKVGWVIMDLGAPTAQLDQMHLWNGSQIGTSALKDFNLYYSTAPVVPATQGPTGGAAADDYDFGVAAWTQVGSTKTLSDGGGVAGGEDGYYSLGGVTARYVALEMMSRHSGNIDPDSGRIGFAEAGFTTVPEPTTTALLGLGGLALIIRRRK